MAEVASVSDVHLLDVRDLTVRYPDRHVLHAVSLHVAAGEVVGLLGPNGAGQSTLMRAVSGVSRIDAGDVSLAGRDIRELGAREIARQVAVVPQEPTFAFPFTVLEVVLMGRHPHVHGLAFESESDLAVAHRALHRAGADDLAFRSIHALSSGERQRVVFARALAQEPRLLLLDEPASFLDIRHQVALYDLVRDLATDERVGVLTVLHDLNLAAEYCDRVYLLKGGRIEAHGPTVDVFTYANLTSAFDTEIYIDTHDLTGGVVVVPISRRTREALGKQGRR